MIASIISDPSITYPGKQDYFSPDKQYPEYPFSHTSTTENSVYGSVRETLRQAGLDIHNYNTSKWNPLGSYIKEGDKVFLLCNFVYHRRHKESVNEFFSKCTHASVLRALIDYVYIATGRAGTITFGNAPLQSCDFQKVLADTGALEMLRFYNSNNVEVSAKDLRLISNKRSILGNIKSSETVDKKDAVLISMNETSLLNELYYGKEEVVFRISDYNPERIQEFHHLNYHKYNINKEILDSDVVLSVPKLKTHEKVGLTVGLKGFVGIVGHKDCLAHHRFGSPKMDGDEYPDNGNLQVVISRFHDFVQKRHFPRVLFPLMEILDVNIRKFLRRILKKIQAGAWYGNDTAWRMALDLTRIIHTADKTGRLCDNVVRENIVFIDGIISGEGNGPLSPKPVDAKCLIFSDNIVLGDLISCKLMGWDKKNIPLILHAIENKNLFLNEENEGKYCIMNNKVIEIDNILPVLGRKFLPAEGWKKVLL